MKHYTEDIGIQQIYNKQDLADRQQSDRHLHRFFSM